MQDGTGVTKTTSDALNILTFDVEDYFQVSNFASLVKFEDWEKHESRVVDNTLKILNILAENDVKATFFVLGWVAEKFPELIKEIYSQGHEIASHGYNHRLIYQQNLQEFRQDIKKAKIILEQITGKPVLGYRAPSYSITKKSIWALDILMEEGFKYDSSLFPVYHDRGGLPEAKRHPYKIYNHQQYLWEFPLSTIRIFNQNIPFSGGGYFRLLPYNFIKWAIKKTNKDGYPIIVYIHPWELDPQQPKIRADYISKFRHYVNISKTEKKLKQLLSDFKFAPVKEVLGLR
jgi:polysaccharide deacetylase family protein (PEP-CTERM system associated)